VEDREQRLDLAMGKLRQALAEERSPAFRKRQLMDEYARIHARERRGAWFRWAGAAAAAATFACAAILVWWPGPGVTELAANGEFAIFGEEGFVAVPYTPPLAAGESVRIVNREIQGVELARMGIDLPGGYTSAFDADIALGDDGWPRAVRLNSEIP
jgi:hypothetical protein